MAIVIALLVAAFVAPVLEFAKAQALNSAQPGIWVSGEADRSPATRLIRTRVEAGATYVYAVPPGHVTKVTFWLDKTTSKKPTKVDRRAPFDLIGSRDGKATPWWPKVGTHTLKVEFAMADGTTQYRTARFKVVPRTRPKPPASPIANPTPTPLVATPTATPTASPVAAPSPSQTPSASPSSTSSPRSDRVAGLNDHPIWMRASQDVAADLILRSNARAVRIDVPWDVIEPERGAYNTMRLGLIDAYVDRMSQEGVDILMVVEDSPPWASGTTDRRMPPMHDADYADFLGFLVERYQGKVGAYEIWNEPNGGWAWTNPDPVRYASLVKAAYTRAKSIDPSAMILAPSLSGPDQGGFLDRFYAQGTKNYFDAFSMHGYWWNLNSTTVLPYHNASNPDASIFGAFNTRILPIMTRYGDQSKPVWWTETGIATSGGPTDESVQADKIDEAFEAWRGGVIPTMSRLYWYMAIDTVGSGAEQNFGLVDLTGTSATLPAAGDFVPKVGYARFQAQAARV